MRDFTFLKARASCFEHARAFFRSRGYWEVETPAISADVCVDVHIEPFRIAGNAPGDQRRYLQTSPEFHMKRLLANGSGSIFQFARVFRSGERGARHNPEFTMLEWYRVGGRYHDLMDECRDFVDWMFELSDDFHSVSAAPRECHRLSYREAFLRFAGVDPGVASPEEMQARAAALGWTQKNSNRDDLLNFLLATLVEPAFAGLQSVLLYDFPASQAALARVRREDPPVAERFEMYLHGVEICNGYQELTDAEELRARNAAANLRRIAEGKPELPAESRLLKAMEHGLPECSGVALGFDRLMMLLFDRGEIGDVLAFAWEEA